MPISRYGDWNSPSPYCEIGENSIFEPFFKYSEIGENHIFTLAGINTFAISPVNSFTGRQSQIGEGYI